MNAQSVLIYFNAETRRREVFEVLEERSALQLTLSCEFADNHSATRAMIMEVAEAEHFRELSVLGKRTGAAIGLCKSRHEVTGRRRRRKWQRGTSLGQ